MTKRGTLTRVGGQAYLHDLIQAVPTAANAGYYAQIVAERAVLRRLVEAGTRIVQLGYGQGEGDVEEIVNRAQAEVYAVADKRGGEDYHRLGDIIEMTVDEIEVASGNGPDQVGIDPIARIRADPPDLFDVRWQLRRREQSREVLTGQLVDAGIVHISQ